MVETSTNGFRRDSMDFLPTVGVQCQQVPFTGKLPASGREGAVSILIVGSGPHGDEAKRAETLVETARFIAERRS